jgi:hypothetical protein
MRVLRSLSKQRSWYCSFVCLGGGWALSGLRWFSYSRWPPWRTIPPLPVLRRMRGRLSYAFAEPWVVLQRVSGLLSVLSHVQAAAAVFPHPPSLPPIDLCCSCNY